MYKQMKVKTLFYEMLLEVAKRNVRLPPRMDNVNDNSARCAFVSSTRRLREKVHLTERVEEPD